MLTVAQARPSERAEFIQKTYLHLAGAVGAFILVEVLLFALGVPELMLKMLSGSQFAWLAILGGFAVLGWLSRSLVAKADSVQTQYVGLGVYVLAEAIIFAPLLAIAVYFSDPSVLPTATILTLTIFGGLTAVAFTSRKDFSFMGGVLTMIGFIAMGLIVCSILFGFSLGLWFSLAMVVFASAAILYSTSKIMYHYTPTQYVAASLELFAAVALLFWYVLRILSSRR
jgi:FtsH-binding integral membrane protein